MVRYSDYGESDQNVMLLCPECGLEWHVEEYTRGKDDTFCYWCNIEGECVR
jgi:uncharacterized Zn ribbon protein